MAGNSVGERFRITTFGESHGGGVGVVIDGCPAGHPFPNDRIATQLGRRRPGQSRLSSQRKEPDRFELLSGVDPSSGKTLGTPITMVVRNVDARSEHYDDIATTYRPSHADYTYDARFGIRAVAGGGRASARETIGRVAAGALAEDLLAATHGIEIVAWVSDIADISSAAPDLQQICRSEVDRHVLRCPDLQAAEAMEKRVLDARSDGDSVGGVIRCVARGVPAGWGEPVFSKLSAEFAAALMSIPAAKGFEIGDGFAATKKMGSEHNDEFYMQGDRVRTRTNHSGGIQGGISNGEIIRLALAFKPVATIFKHQQSVTQEGRDVRFSPRKGRHDPCVVARAVPIVESMVALVLCDHMLRRAGIRFEEL